MHLLCTFYPTKSKRTRDTPLRLARLCIMSLFTCSKPVSVLWIGLYTRLNAEVHRMTKTLQSVPFRVISDCMYTTPLVTLMRTGQGWKLNDLSRFDKEKNVFADTHELTTDFPFPFGCALQILKWNNSAYLVATSNILDKGVLKVHFFLSYHALFTR